MDAFPKVRLPSLRLKIWLSQISQCFGFLLMVRSLSFYEAYKTVNLSVNRQIGLSKICRRRLLMTVRSFNCWFTKMKVYRLNWPPFRLEIGLFMQAESAEVFFLKQYLLRLS